MAFFKLPKQNKKGGQKRLPKEMFRKYPQENPKQTLNNFAWGWIFHQIGEAIFSKARFWQFFRLWDLLVMDLRGGVKQVCFIKRDKIYMDIKVHTWGIFIRVTY